MSILEIILIIVLGIVGGFILGFIIFFIITFITNWNAKRKLRKITREEMKAPIKHELTEKEVKENADKELQEFRQYRQFDKLRAFAEAGRGNERGKFNTSNVIGESQRNDFPNEINNELSTVKPNNDGNSGKIRWFK